MELIPDTPGVRDARRIANDHRHLHAAAVRVLLVPAKRRVPHLRPAPRNVAVAVGAADVIQFFLHRVEILQRHWPTEFLSQGPPVVRRVAHAPRLGVHDAVGPAVLAGAVVRGEDDHGVVQLADGAQMLDEASDLRIGMFEEPRPRLLQPADEFPFVLAQRFPARHAGIAWRQPRALWYDTEFDLSGEISLAQDVPPFVETAAVLVDVRLRGLVRVVHGAGREVGEERRLGPDGLKVIDELDGVVHQVIRQVVSLLRCFRRRHRMVVAGQVRIELGGRTGQESVEAVKAALQRPVVVGSCGGAGGVGI